MAWDTERTRRLLLDAAVSNFAAHGFAGASVQRIAVDAGVNKERIYQYFGDKRGLFERAIEAQVVHLLDGVEVDGKGPDAVGAFAGALHDRVADRPALARLLAWESLELGAPAATEERREHCASMAAALRRAVPSTDGAGAEQLLLTIVFIVTAEQTLSHLSDVILTSESARAARRAAVVAQATALARVEG